MAAGIPFPQDDILFLDNDVYRYGILDEIGSTAFYAGKIEEGYNACKALLDRNLIPQTEVERVKNNFKEYEKIITNIKIKQLETKAEKKIEKKEEQKKVKAFKQKERVSR